MKKNMKFIKKLCAYSFVMAVVCFLLNYFLPTHWKNEGVELILESVFYICELTFGVLFIFIVFMTPNANISKDVTIPEEVIEEIDPLDRMETGYFGKTK